MAKRKKSPSRKEQVIALAKRIARPVVLGLVIGGGAALVSNRASSKAEHSGCQRGVKALAENIFGEAPADKVAQFCDQVLSTKE